MVLMFRDSQGSSNLANRLGFGHAYTEGRDELGWLKHMYEGARARAQALGFEPPEFQDFWEAGACEFPSPPESRILLGEFRRDPVRHPLATPSGRIEIFSSTIADYRYADCPPHPTWLEAAEWLGSAATSRFPLHLLSNQPTPRLHSQHDHAPLSRRSKVSGREALAMRPDDARLRGLAQGDVVRVFNERGAFLAGLVVTDHLGPGVVQISTGAWYDPVQGGQPGSLEKHGNPNVVTMARGTSQLAQSTMVQTALVQVEKCDEPPPVTAFDLPQFASRRSTSSEKHGRTAVGVSVHAVKAVTFSIRERTRTKTVLAATRGCF